MNVTLTEGSLRFAFSGVRIARRWDGSSAYKQGLRRLSTTAAADFCAILEQNDTPVLIEVTDYRGYRLGRSGSKHAQSSGALIAETVAKVRDSVAGMLWACARSLDAATDPAVESVVRHIVNRHDGPPRLQVVFWLEDDVLQPQEASTIANQIEAGLRHWLRPKVIVTNKRIEQMARAPLAWLSVT
jgi:hypothetical protein